MSHYITHITLSTGHTRNSPRAEVSDDILGVLHPWLFNMLSRCERLPLPMPALAHYSASATIDEGSLLCTIWGPAGPHIAGRKHAGEVAPLVTIGVAQRNRHGIELWGRMIAQFEAAPDIKRPVEPWCAVVIHPSLSRYPDCAEWLGELERCIAWAWITRKTMLREA